MSGNAGWHALVVGIDDYPGFGSGAGLGGCVNDATTMRELLVDRLGVADDHIVYLTAPTGNVPGTGGSATAAGIRAAMDRLRDPHVVARGDQVLLFLAGHGVRLRRGLEMYYGFAARDAGRGADEFAGLILDHEINDFLSALSTTNGASVTVIADTCHSGGATRRLDRAGEGAGPRVRGLELTLDVPDEAWARALQSHPALGHAGRPVRSAPGPRSSGWLSGAQHGGWVVLSACHDGETAKEITTTVLDAAGAARPITRGVLSSALFDALARLAPQALMRVRWMDIVVDIQRGVADRLQMLQTTWPRLTPQRPLLEGRAERSVFGGAWAAFAPGFSVHATTGGSLVVDGGRFHGIAPGAELALFAPGTPDFDEALRRGVVPRRARVIAATAATSEAVLVAPEGGAGVEQGARARLVKPAPGTPELLVRAVHLPVSIERAAIAAEGGAGFFRFSGPDEAAHVEVRPWLEGWAIVSLDDQGAPMLRQRAEGGSDPSVSVLQEAWPLTPEDIIAHVPSRDAAATRTPIGDDKLGRALAAALTHWARYLSVRERRSDEDLKAFLAVDLRVGCCDPVDAHGAMSDALAPRRLPGPDGVFEMLEGEWFKVELEVLRASALELFVGLVACSDDGNVIPMWPPRGAAPSLVVGERLYIGQDRIAPAMPEVRRDQRFSRYTIKVFAFSAPEGSAPFDLSGMGLDQTVQDVVDASLDPRRLASEVVRGGLGAAQVSERAACCCWTLRVVVRRSGEGEGV